MLFLMDISYCTYSKKWNIEDVVSMQDQLWKGLWALN